MAFQDLIRYGVNTQGDRFQGLGEAAKQGFLEGEQRVQQMEDRVYLENERKRIADAREQKELDAFYGDIYVPPTGQVSYDAGVEMMAREWKSQFAALNAAKKAGQISNEDYVAQKHDIMNRAQTLKQGQEVLTNFHQMYQKAVAEDQLSGSTPARIRLLGQALEDGTVQIQNIDGRPTVVGQLEDGEPVQIDLGSLANGSANLRINQKVDTSGLVNQVAKGLEGYKTTVATENGLALGNVGWDMIQEKAAQDIDELLNNQSTVQAIAADQLGMNHEEIEALGQEEVANRVGDYLLDQVQKNYFPVEKFSSYSPDKPPGSQSYAPNASLIKLNQQNQKNQQISNVISSGSLEQLNGLNGYKIEPTTTGYFGFGDKAYKITLPDGTKQTLPLADAQAFLQNALVGVPIQQQQGGASEADPLGLGFNSPINRNGDGPDKKKKSKKEKSHSLYFPGYTKHFSGNTDFGRLSGQGSPYASDILGSEGGQGGLIYSQKRQAPDRKGGTVYTLGALRNSYGDPIAAGTIGREWTLGKDGRTKIGIHGGATYGYGKSFGDRQANIQAFNEANPDGVYDPQSGKSVNFRDAAAQYGKGLYGFIKDTNIAPVVNAQVSHDFGGDPNSGLGISALLNPLYANLGLQYRFGKGKNKKKNKKKK